MVCVSLEIKFSFNLKSEYKPCLKKLYHKTKYIKNKDVYILYRFQ